MCLQNVDEWEYKAVIQNLNLQYLNKCTYVSAQYKRVYHHSNSCHLYNVLMQTTYNLQYKAK